MKRVYWLAGIAVGLLALHEVLTAWIDAAAINKVGLIIPADHDVFPLLNVLAIIFALLAAADLLWMGLRKWHWQVKRFFRPAGRIGRLRWKVFFWLIGGIAALLVLLAIGSAVSDNWQTQPPPANHSAFDPSTATLVKAPTAKPPPFDPVKFLNDEPQAANSDAKQLKGDIFDQLAADAARQKRKSQPVKQTNPFADLIPKKSPSMLVRRALPVATPQMIADAFLNAPDATPTPAQTPKRYPIPGTPLPLTREILVVSKTPGCTVEVGAAYIGRTPCKITVDVYQNPKGFVTIVGSIRTVTVTDSRGLPHSKLLEPGDPVPKEMYFQ